MKKKIKIISIVGICFFCTISIFSITAYFSTQQNKADVFEVGFNELKINTNNIDKSNIQSNTTIKKTISVTNTGETDSFIRVFIDFSDSTIKDNFATLDINTKDWTFYTSSDLDLSNGSYGYFYYKKVLKPNETTSDLLNGISFSNIDTMLKFQLITYGESIQANQEGFSKDLLDENGYPKLEKAFDVLLNKTK